jgi:iron complex transport system substrate-binding protein
MLSRREFIASSAVGALGLAAGAPALSGCSAASELLSGKQTVTDSIGRQVTLPSPHKLERIYFTSALAQIFCFTVAPDLLGASCTSYTEDQLQFLPEGIGDLPNLGTLSGGGTIDAQALKYQEIQVIFSISGVDLTDVNIADVQRLERESGIPGVLIDGSFDVIGDSYRLLGQCLGREQRGDDLAKYCEQIYDRVTAAIERVPESERVTYYFAEGTEGLQTEPNSSQHSVAFTAAGGVNVAADVAYVPGSGGMVDVPFSDVAAWDPQFIITWDGSDRNGAARLIRASSQWANVRAVREGNVFEMPKLPFAFCDRPPGVNRFLGIQWLANLFYPSYYDVDMVEVVRDFYARCYWRDISVEQAKEVLDDSYRGALS